MSVLVLAGRPARCLRAGAHPVVARVHAEHGGVAYGRTGGRWTLGSSPPSSWSSCSSPMVAPCRKTCSRRWSSRTVTGLTRHQTYDLARSSQRSRWGPASPRLPTPPRLHTHRGQSISAERYTHTKRRPTHRLSDTPPCVAVASQRDVAFVCRNLTQVSQHCIILYVIGSQLTITPK